MEKFLIDNDIIVLCVSANSFPEGVSEAHERLHSLLPNIQGRNFYGLSSPNQLGEIVYKAAVEQQYVGEAKQLKCESFVLRKGEYIGSIVYDFPNHMQEIGKVFNDILGDPRIDHKGCCVEVYLNEKDVQCMVRIDSSVK